MDREAATSEIETKPLDDLDLNNDPPIDRHCAFCLVEIPAKDVLRCGKCRRRAYCSKDCQRADWTVVGGSSSLEARGQGHKNWCGVEYGEEDLDWKVIPVEGKGLGLIALRTIPDRFRIMVDACQEENGSHPATNDLMPVRGSLKDKFDLNCFGCEDKDGKDFKVLCLRLSRANHNCDANACHVYDKHFKTKILFSEREIAAGEEICIAYTSIAQLHFTHVNPEYAHVTPEDARRSFRRKWGFDCPNDCRCRDPGVISVVRKAMELDKRISTLAQDKGLVGMAIHEVQTLMDLHNSIQYSLLIKKKTLIDGVKIAVSTQETLEKGRRFVAQLVDICASILHPKNPELLEHQKWKEDIRSHPNYLRFEKDPECVIA